jgi:hypothetical protein
MLENSVSTVVFEEGTMTPSRCMCIVRFGGYFLFSLLGGLGKVLKGAFLYGSVAVRLLGAVLCSRICSGQCLCAFATTTLLR